MLPVRTSDFKSLFITKLMAGFLVVKNERDPQTRKLETYSEFRIFDTDTGKFITSCKLPPHCGQGRFVSARGPYLCYSRAQFIHVVRLCGERVEQFDLKFPTGHFARVRGSSFGQYDLSQSRCSFIDFLGKSHVLLGNLKVQPLHTHLLFGLDLDAAVAAKTEEELCQAFSLPLTSKSVKCPNTNGLSIHSSVDMYRYKPVYMTDRITGCVEMVGVTRKKLESDAAMVESHYFVTEIQ